MNAVSGGLDSLGSKGSGVMGALGTGLKDVAIAGAAAGVAAGAFFTASINAAADFQSSMAKVQGLAGATADQMNTYNQGILDLTTKIPVSAKDAADGLFFVVSAGYKGADAMQVLSVSAEAAASGLGSTKDIAGLVTSALTDYKLTADDAKTITDKLTAAVTDGKASADEFAPALAKVLPIAASMGISFDQVTASVATMTRAGLTASEAGTALRGVLSSLDKPGQQAQDALASIGLSAGQLKDKIANEGLMQTLDDLMKMTGGDVETLGMIIPNIRALTGVLASAGQQQDSYAQTLTDIQNSAGKTDKAFAVAKDTFNFQLGLLKNDLNKILIEVGSALLPLVTPILTSLGGALTNFGKMVNDFITLHKKDFVDFANNAKQAFVDLSDRFQQDILPKIKQFFDWIRDTAQPIIQQLVSFVRDQAMPAISQMIDTQIVPRAQALWGIIQQIGNWFKTVVLPAAIKEFQIAMQWLGDHKEAVVGALLGLAAAQAVLTAAEVAGAVAAAAANLPLIAVIATIALLGGGIALLITHWDDIVKKFPVLGQVANDVKQELQSFVDWLTSNFWPKSVAAFQAIVTWVQANWGDIKSLLTGPIEIAYALIKGQFDLIKDVVQTTLKVIGDIISIALDLISGNWKGAWEGVKQLLSDVWGGIQTIVGDQLTMIEGVLNGAWDLIQAALIGPFTWFRDNIGGVISAAVNFMLAPLNSAIDGFNALGRGITNAVNWVTDKLGLGKVMGEWSDIGHIAVNLNFSAGSGPTGNVGHSAASGIGSGFAAVNRLGGGVSGVNSGLNTNGVGTLATGGSMADGWSWVGERGAELAHKSGSNITIVPAAESTKLAASMGMKIPGYFLGTPNWGDALGDIGSAIKNAGSDAVNFAKEWLGKGIDKLVDTAFDQFGVKAPELPGKLAGIGPAVFGQLKDKVVDAIKQIFDKGKSALGTAQPGTPAQVDAWIMQAIAATGADPSWEQGLDIIADFESTGDPNAYNPIDVGGGQHAQGLMQTIGSTFAAYAMSGHGNIYDPVDNAIAAIRYIQARYGNINNVPGVASVLAGGPYLPYANGGLITEPIVGVGQNTGTQYKIGENDNELIVGGSGDPALNLKALVGNTALIAQHSGHNASVAEIIATATSAGSTAAAATAAATPDIVSGVGDTSTATGKVVEITNRWLGAIWDTVTKIYMELVTHGTSLTATAGSSTSTAASSATTAANTGATGPVAAAITATNKGGLAADTGQPQVGRQTSQLGGLGGGGASSTDTLTFTATTPATLASIDTNTAETVKATRAFTESPFISKLSESLGTPLARALKAVVGLGGGNGEAPPPNPGFSSINDLSGGISTVVDGINQVAPAVVNGVTNAASWLMNGLSTQSEKVGGNIAQKTIDLTGIVSKQSPDQSQTAAAAALIAQNTTVMAQSAGIAEQGLTIAQQNAVQASTNLQWAEQRAEIQAAMTWGAFLDWQKLVEKVGLQGTGIKTNLNFDPVNFGGGGFVKGPDTQSNEAFSAMMGRMLGSGSGFVQHFANGGLLNEPVVGFGAHSGSIYTMAETRPEYIDPNTSQMKAPTINNYNFSENSVVIPAKDLAEMQDVQTFFERFNQAGRSK